MHLFLAIQKKNFFWEILAQMNYFIMHSVVEWDGENLVLNEQHTSYFRYIYSMFIVSVQQELSLPLVFSGFFLHKLMKNNIDSYMNLHQSSVKSEKWGIFWKINIFLPMSSIWRVSIIHYFIPYVSVALLLNVETSWKKHWSDAKEKSDQSNDLLKSLHSSIVLWVFIWTKICMGSITCWIYYL